MKRTTYCQDGQRTLEATAVKNKTIVLPFEEATYSELLEDKSAYKAHILTLFHTYPELFPDTMRVGWSLFGFTRLSAKQQIRLRRIQTQPDQEVWQIRPSFVMPLHDVRYGHGRKDSFFSKMGPTLGLGQGV